MELISGLDTDKPVFVEGGFKTWLNGTMLKYYTLRSETSETFKKSQLPIDKEEEEKSKSIRIVQLFRNNNGLKEQNVLLTLLVFRIMLF